MSNQQDIVVDDGRSRISDLWKKEDYWAIWIGFIIMIVASLIMFGGKAGMESRIASADAIIKAESAKPFQTIELINAKDEKAKVTGANLPAAKTLISYLKTPSKWEKSPVDSFIGHVNEAAKPAADEAKAAAAAALTAAQEAQKAAADASFENADLNKAAQDAIAAWQKAGKAAGDAAKKVGANTNSLPGMVVLGVVLGLLTAIGAAFMGMNVVRYLIGFAGVWILCVFANFLGGYKPTSTYGLNGEIWSIIVGMLISNTIGTPKWIKPAVQVEYFIKIGLVLLGAEVLFNKILAIGIPGIFVAWVVTPIVLVSTYIFGQKVLKMPSKTLNIVISSDMSVCGTSAAIAAAAACRAKKEELTLSVGMSMVFTAIMMIVLPAIIRAVGMPEILGGAWIGGTIDATGSVAAAGAFVGPKAMQVAATVKMIQNVLIGVTAFCIAIYFTTKVEAKEGGRTVGAMEIWNRFPKFVIGFIAASIIMSYIAGSYDTAIGNALIGNGVNKVTVPLRGWFFTLAFVCIGLATNFKELAKYFKGGKPVILYVCGQSLNLCLTLLMAWIMFYKVFPEITATI